MPQHAHSVRNIHMCFQSIVTPPPPWLKRSMGEQREAESPGSGGAGCFTATSVGCVLLFSLNWTVVHRTSCGAEREGVHRRREHGQLSLFSGGKASGYCVPHSLAHTGKKACCLGQKKCARGRGQEEGGHQCDGICFFSHIWCMWGSKVLSSEKPLGNVPLLRMVSLVLLLR